MKKQWKSQLSNLLEKNYTSQILKIPFNISKISIGRQYGTQKKSTQSLPSTLIIFNEVAEFDIFARVDLLAAIVVLKFVWFPSCLCAISWFFLRYEWWHKSHGNGFFPLQFFTCVLKLELRALGWIKPHLGHWLSCSITIGGSSFVWTRVWVFK